MHEPINEGQVLDQSVKGVMAPEVEHDAEPLDDDTEFYIEFFLGVEE